MTVLFNGLTNGMLIFMVASGLTLILGVMRIVNFAHGGFFLVGAYLAYTFLRGRVEPTWLFITMAVAAAAATAVVGLVSERLIFRRLYKLPAIASLLGTYAVMLLLEGAVELLWGMDPRTQPQPTSLTTPLDILGGQIPRYDIVVFVFGSITAAGLGVLTTYTRFGRRVTAVAEDRYMAELLGINVNTVFALTFALGIFLAGLGGALAGPTLTMVPDIALTFILQAFAVVIVGGFGSIVGSLIAALVLGVLNSYLVSIAPSVAAFSLYFLMALILVVRPTGLLGKAGAAGNAL